MELLAIFAMMKRIPKSTMVLKILKPATIATKIHPFNPQIASLQLSYLERNQVLNRYKLFYEISFSLFILKESTSHNGGA